MSKSQTQPTISTATLAGHFGSLDWVRINRALLLGLIAAFVIGDVELLRVGLAAQPLGIDFLPLWTGGRVDPSRLYDFAFLTDQQGWLLTGKVRPFVYPPSALPLFKLFAVLPFWPSYAVLIGVTGTLFVWMSGRLGADRRLVIAATPVLLVAMAGQTTFLIGALVMAAILTRRPVLSGLLFGIAGAIKPQMLVLLPFALIVEGEWRVFWVTAATAAACAAVSLLFGASWVEWLQALPKFTQLVEHDPRLVATTLTPHASWGHISLVFTVPAALAGVWFAFRFGDSAQKVLALLGGALIVSPYAMSYEIALLVPALLALRKPLVWSLPFWIALIYYSSGPMPLMVAMTLLFISLSPAISETRRLLFARSGVLQQA